MDKQVLSFNELYRSLKDPNSSSISFASLVVKDSSIILTNSDLSRGLRNITFIECDFEGGAFFLESIVNGHLNVLFDNCSFLTEINIDKCEFNTLKFFDTKEIKSIDIIGSKVSNFYFRNKSEKSKYDLKGRINISGNVFKNKSNLENLKHSSGSFTFYNILEVKKRASSNDRLNASFANSNFHNADFSETNFGEEIGFDKMILSGSQCAQNFNDCSFGKVYFNGTDFGKYAFFNGSTFNGLTIFNGCINPQETIIDFSGCEVKNPFNMVYSKFKSLIIKNVAFENQVSFQNSEFDKVSFENLSFEKQAFFDDIEINNVKDCNRKSLRTIKYQLQKTDNRIDYNKFKAYELRAYRRELEAGQWKDKFILWLNHFSSRHGLDWIRSVVFTLLFGMIAYSLYYLLEHAKPQYIFDLNNGFNHFIGGYFNYLIPSYKSPFEYGLQNAWLYFPFLFGKIFIGYGIYQTIVSFRKFRL